jgi:hypothetical protein
MNKELRATLSKIVSPENEDNWWRTDLFEKNTRPILPKELEILASPPPAKQGYNCFVYALGFSEDPRFLGGENGWPFGDRFITDLIKKGFLTETKLPQKGDVVLYEDDKMITHAGLMESAEVVVSKWSWGPLLRHKLWDVPAHYGDKISFYKFNQSSKPEIAALAMKISAKRRQVSGD